MATRKRSGWKTYIRDQYLEDLAAFFRDPKTRAILVGFADDPRKPLRYKEIWKLGSGEVPDRAQSLGGPDKKINKEWNHNSCSAFIQNLVRWKVLRSEGDGKGKQYFLDELWWGEAKRAKTILDLEENSPAAIATKIVKESGGPEVLEKDELPQDPRLDELIKKFKRADQAPYIPSGSTFTTGGATLYGGDIKLDPTREKAVKEALARFDYDHRSLSHKWYMYTRDKYVEEFRAEVKKRLRKWQAPAVSSEWVAYSVCLRDFLYYWKKMEISQAIHQHILGVESPDLPSLKTPSELGRTGRSQAERCLECLPADISADQKEAIMMGAEVFRLLMSMWLPRYNEETHYAGLKELLKLGEPAQVVKELWVEIQAPKTAPQSAPHPTTEGTPRCYEVSKPPCFDIGPYAREARETTFAAGSSICWDLGWENMLRKNGLLISPASATDMKKRQLMKGVEALMSDFDVFVAVAKEIIEEVKGTVPPVTTVISSRLPPNAPQLTKQRYFDKGPYTREAHALPTGRIHRNPTKKQMREAVESAIHESKDDPDSLFHDPRDAQKLIGRGTSTKPTSR